MTLLEYDFRVKAKNLQLEDEDYKMHKSAWLNRIVKDVDTSGKYLYGKWKNFYHPPKPKNKANLMDDKTLKELLLKANSKGG